MPKSRGLGAPPTRTCRLSGWGRVPVQTCHVFRPDAMAGAARVLAEGGQRTYLARGRGRAYGDAALNEGAGVVSFELLDRLLEFDPANGNLLCEGGTSLARILEVFVPRGWFLPVTPGTRHVTVAGAVACDVHGKNHHRDGSFSAFVTGLELLTGTGEPLDCSRTSQPEAFWATVGGMGLTGLIRSVRLRLLPIESAWMRVDVRRASDLDATLELLEAADRSATYSVAWIDGSAAGSSLGRSIVTYGEHALAAQLPPRRQDQPLAAPSRRVRTVPRWFPGWLVNRTSVGLFNSAYWSRHREQNGQIVDYPSFFYPLDVLHAWHRLYGRPGFVQYQAVFPAVAVRAGVSALLEAVRAAGRTAYLGVLKHLGPASEGLLSFPLEGATLALDFPYRGRGFAAFTRRLDAIVARHGGRVYLAKDAFLSADAFAAMYPGAERFRQVRRRLDPQGRFSSSLGRRLGLVERT